MADSHAAMYDHGCTEPGTGKATFGTGSSVMTPCEKPDRAPDGHRDDARLARRRPAHLRP